MRENKELMEVLRDLQAVCEKHGVAITESDIYPGVILLDARTDEYIAKNVIIDPGFYEAESLIDYETISELR